uniref:hypothetical protein n=1 Tax=Streptomyces sp. YIM 98790 TaxID=2689077 RepID=UPI00140B5119
RLPFRPPLRPRFRPRFRLRPAVAGSALLAALALALALAAPPVRATVAGWFGIGAVQVRLDPSLRLAEAEPPACGELGLDEAERRAGFAAVLPPGLGPPDSAGVTDDGRLLSVCWHAGAEVAIRLDQAEAALDPVLYKSTPPDGLSWTEVNGRTALWLPGPHLVELSLTGPDGAGTAAGPRPAGPTLVWELSGHGRTLRLEGIASRHQAVSLAATVPAP